MAITVQHYKSAAWNDITDYVESCGVVPFNPVNRDYSLQAQTWDVVIAVTIRDFYSDPSFNFAVNDKIRVYSGATLVFSGYVDKAVYVYGSMNFNLRIKTSIMKLMDKHVQYDDLHTQFATGTNWYDYTAASWYYSMPIVGVMWAMKSMFAVSGLTLDISEVEGVDLFTRYASGGDFDPNVTIKYRHLYFYEDVLYCVGQNVSVSHTVLDTKLDYDEAKKTCFDVVSFLCSTLRLAVRLVDVDSYKLIAFTTNYNTAATGGDIDDDDKFDYSKEWLRASDARVSWGATIFLEANLLKYSQTNETAIQSGTNGAGTSLGYLQNFWIFFSDAINKTNKYADEHAYVVCTGEYPPSTDFIIDDATVSARLNLLSILYREKLNDYLQEVVLTNIKTNEKTVIGNNIDLVWENSEITQETY